MNKYLSLLRTLIATPSFSKQEQSTANIIADFLSSAKIDWKRLGNNIWARNKYFDTKKESVLLNSHHDTVRPAKTYTRDPFDSEIKHGKLYGLGSNDAGGALVALIATFSYFYDQKNLKYNLILAASAEEEISGKNGIALLLPKLGNITFGLVGEPTQMQMAIAEKGLMVIDGIARGKSGHAARAEGENAIYKAMQDVEYLRNLSLKEVSPLLGATKLSITQINAGTQHNVVPDECRFVVDIRTNEYHHNEDLFQLLQEQTLSELTARSFRLNSSKIDLNHPLVQSGKKLGLTHYGSPTLSDQALMPFPTLKIGPGDSARSHTADEFIYVQEIEDGIAIYRQLLEGVLF
ncbi:MAG: M20 family metallo-hydrolase [Bacteroidota bacterium]